jgi:DNA-binding transcriptional ArsR family regulator
MADDVLILEPGDVRAQKIAKAISSQTAGDILNQMKEGGYTASQLAETLNLPLTTVQYHLENLVEAAMLIVIEKRWSKKGREIKVYGLRNQVVIVAPHPGDVRSLLLKYASLFGIVVLAGVVMLTLLTLFPGGTTPPLPLQEKGSTGEDLRVDSVPASAPPADNNFLFFVFIIFGGGVAIVALAGFELWKHRSSATFPFPAFSRDR